MKVNIFDKVNCYDIITQHFKTLVNNNTKKPDWDDWITFFWVPLLIAGGTYLLNGTISANTVNTIITALSIFVGLLINVLVLVFTLVQSAKSRLNVLVLKETIVNISYTIIISLLTIFLCLLTFINNSIVLQVCTIVIYTFVVHFFITLLMIVKRMFILLTKEMDQKQRTASVEPPEVIIN